MANREVISMPDSWEYPWYAAWDLGFHAVALAHLDPSYAKSQLLLLCREWYMHPDAQLPAYEWDFGDVNPPVQAGLVMAVWRIDAHRRAQQGLPPDNDFLERAFHKLLLNFTWWVNQTDAEGNNVFEGGFLGLDNIGLFDRSRPLPVPGVLEQSDGTAWMGMYRISLLEIALRLADTDPTYEDIAIKFYEHFTYIAGAMHSQGLWDVDDGFFYDVIKFPDGHSVPVKARSLVGVVPLLAVTTLHPALAAKLPDFVARTEWFQVNRPKQAAYIAHTRVPGMQDRLLLSVSDGDALQRALGPRPRPGRDALPVWGSKPVALPPGAPFYNANRRRHGADRLRTGGVDDGPLRWKFKLAGPGLVPGQLPLHRRAVPLQPVLRRVAKGRAPGRLRGTFDPRRSGGRTHSPARVPVPTGP